MYEIQKIHHFVEQQAALIPQKVALSFYDKQLTYAELNVKANQVAQFLIAQGAQKGDLIPIISEKSLESVVALLAILKIGAAYIPVNAESTESMMATVIEHSKAKILFAQSKVIPSVSATNGLIVHLDYLFEKTSQYPVTNPDYLADKSDLAYVIYTSGTTGLPKGVMVTHHNLIHTYLSWETVYQLTSSDVHLQMANPAFDVFAGDWLRALCSGAKLVLCPKDVLLNPAHLYQLIVNQKITCAEFVPSVLRALLSYLSENKQRLRQFRLLLCGSDLWTMGEYRQTRELFGQGTRVINSYGLTEVTIDSTYFEETTATTDEFSKPDSELVPIGKPFPHVHIYVLNESLKSLPPLEMGEIYIGGEGVAAGYLGQEKMTNERFIVHPEMKERLYKTGDFGKVLTNGTIEFFGRNQTHVKINGQRVELLTLDSILNQHPKIQYSIAYPIFSSSNDTSLGCVVLPSDDSVSFDELVLYIKEHLPIYYVPKTIDVIKEIVINQNGKIDRAITSQKIVKSLKPFVVPPKTVLEKKIAGIWQKWLNLDEIGITHQFCDLGGSSLAFVSMLEEVNRTFNTKISYCAASSTIEGLTKLISLSEDVNAKRLMANHECKSLEG